MSERLVVACRMTGVLAAPSRQSAYLEKARAEMARAEAQGGVLHAWGGTALAFSWDAADIEEAIRFATRAAGERIEGEPIWCLGVAEGSMHELGREGRLAWGQPLVLAESLARIAAPGEVLVDRGLSSLSSGELLALGKKFGTTEGHRVRGARLDVDQPWKKASAAQISRLLDAPLVGRAAELETLRSSPGTVTLLRADPGLGGSRMIAELRALTAPSPSILLTPSSVKAEPLGALRRAFTHLAGSEPLKFHESLHEPLNRLLAGEGIGMAHATSLVRAYLTPREGSKPKDPPPALLIDDAIEIDGATLEASLRAAAETQARWLIVARVDALAEVPSAFGLLPPGKEVELRPLAAEDAARILEHAMKGALSPKSAMRWARRGGFTPLGVIEAVTSGLATGELAWLDRTARGRRKSAGRGSPRPASFWIAQRAEELSPEARAVLVAIALLGGTASLPTITAVVHKMSASIDLDTVMPLLLKARWLRTLKDGSLSLPTRSHREAVLQLMNDARSRAWHRAIGEAVEHAGGALRLAEASQHAAKAGDGAWAARLAHAAAKRATELGHDTAAMRLVAFARAQDPTAASLPEMPPVSMRGPAIAPSIAPPPSRRPSSSSLARMGAMQDLSAGHTRLAVRTLRAELERLDDAGAVERSKAALALGLALAHAGEATEALLAALEGLARAREGGDRRGEQACMMLVAKLLAPSEADAKRVSEAALAKV